MNEQTRNTTHATIVFELMTIHRDYRALLEKRQLLKEEQTALELHKLQIEAVIKADISMERSVDGKKVYGNDLEREGEFFKQMKERSDLLTINEQLVDKFKRINALTLEIDCVELQCKNFRSIIESLPRETRMIAYPGGSS